MLTPKSAQEKETGHAHSAKSLLCRYNRIVANFGSTRLKVDKLPSKVRSLTQPRLKAEEVSFRNSIAHSEIKLIEIGQASSCRRS